MSTYAPYNFIPFAERPLCRYESVKDLPSHGTWDPELLSGEIRLTVTAKTPIYIGNGGKKEAADFFRSPDGRYAIPGSTLRGLVRTNMQILGFGLLRRDEDFQNYRILFRRMADASGSLGDPLKKEYQTILDIQNKPPKNVRGGFLHCEKKGQYYIRAVDTIYLAKKNHPDNEKWKDLAAQNLPIFFKRIGVTEHGEPMVILSETGGEGYQKGTLHCVGRMKRQNTLYVFPQPAEDAEKIELNDAEITAYREDFEARKNSLAGTDRNHPMNKEFWELPKEGESKPVFFFQKGRFTSFGMSRYLRIAYDSSIEAGLPPEHQAFAEELFLDYPYAILGYATKEESYRSRICFGDLPAKGTPGQPALLQTQLGGPKISFFPGYAKDGKHYNIDSYRFRGFKQYWLKEKAEPLQQVTDPRSIRKFDSTLRPLPVGTSFSGSIRYRNLHPDELGLLLWCLVLDNGCQQNIGMGRPYGYGRVEIHIDSLWEQDSKTLYGKGKLLAAPTPLLGGDARARVEALIKAYTESDEIQRRAKKGIRQMPIVRDFLGMKRQIVPEDDSKFSYMPLDDFKNLSKALPTARDILSELQNSNPAASVSQSTAPARVGDEVNCVVTGITSMGVQVKVGSNQTGLIAPKELNTTVNKIQKNMVLRARVISEMFGQLMLSCKQVK